MGFSWNVVPSLPKLKIVHVLMFGEDAHFPTGVVLSGMWLVIIELIVIIAPWIISPGAKGSVVKIDTDVLEAWLAVESGAKVDKYTSKIEEVVLEVRRPKLNLNLLRLVEGEGKQLVWSQHPFVFVRDCFSIS